MDNENQSNNFGNQPYGPHQPLQPQYPRQSMQPSQPGYPEQSSQPEQSQQPITPTQPYSPIQPAQTPQSTYPSQPVQPTQPPAFNQTNQFEEPQPNPLIQPDQPSSTSVNQPNPEDKKESKLRAFFKKPTNVLLTIIVGLILIVLIIVGIVSATSQGIKSQETANPIETNATSEEDSTTTPVNSDTDTTDTSTTIKPSSSTEVLTCTAEGNFYTLKNTYTVVNNNLSVFNTTLELDKVEDPATLSEEDRATYERLVAMGDDLKLIKEQNLSGVTVNLSDNDSSLYIWMNSHKDSITDEYFLKTYYDPYEGLTAAQLKDGIQQSGAENYNMLCEL